jgi:DNA-binding XRE family transcriptional regulator
MDNNLLQADVAKILGVCEDSVVGWENGRTCPLKRQMQAIAQILGYSLIGIITN